MLVGHHAVGLGAKRFAPLVSLGTLQVACLFPDLLNFVDQIAGIEHARITPGITAFSALDGYDIAISHSLLTDVVWSGVFALGYFWWRRDLRGSTVLFAAVFSHWVLSPKVGGFKSPRNQIFLLELVGFRAGPTARSGLGVGTAWD